MRSFGVGAVVIYCVSLVQHFVAVYGSGTVDLALTAPWGTLDLILEIVETVALENETAYFPLISDLQGAQVSLEGGTLQEVYESALQRVEENGHVCSKSALDLLKLGLSLHVSAPRVAAYHQYYRHVVYPSTNTSFITCEAWVVVRGNSPFCDPAEFGEYLDKNYLRLVDRDAVRDEDEDGELLSFDHVWNPSGERRLSIILYTPNLSSPAFTAFHRLLMEAARTYHGLAYVIRYKPVAAADVASSARPFYLTGYGVELALKSTDYLVIDDRKAEELYSKSSSVKDKLVRFGKKVMSPSHLFGDVKSDTIEPLAAKDIKELGLKTAQFLIRSKQPLSDMVQIAQDFPRYAHSISQVELDHEPVEEILINQESMPAPGLNVMWLNGLEIDDDQVDPFSLLRALRREFRTVGLLERQGLTGRQAINVMTHPTLAKAAAGSNRYGDEIKDVYDVRSDIVMWWNDLGKDKRYKSWPSSLFELMKPVYPGQLRTVRRNVYNLVMIEDLASATSLERVAVRVRDSVKNNTPIRFGLVPRITQDDGDPGTCSALAFEYIREKQGRTQAMEYLNRLLDVLRKTNTERVSCSQVEEVYGTLLKGLKESNYPTIAELVQAKQEYLSKTRSFLKRVGMANVEESEGVMFLNGKLLEYNNDDKPWTRVLMMALTEQTQLIARKLYFGQLRQNADVYEFLLTQPYVATSRNPFISVSETQPLRMLALQDIDPKFFEEIHYLSDGSNSEPLANIWIIGNMDSISTLKMALEAISFSRSQDVRLALIHNPTASSGEGLVLDDDNSFSTLLYHQLVRGSADFDSIEALITKALLHRQLVRETPDNDDGPEQIKIFAPGSPIVEQAAKHDAKAWEEQLRVLERAGLASDFTGIILNGRIVGPIPSQFEFTRDDFENLFRYESEKRILPIQEALSEAGADMESYYYALADMLSYVSCVLEADKASMAKSVFDRGVPASRQRPYRDLQSNYTKIAVGDCDRARIEIAALLDPASETAQKWAPILETLSEMQDVYIEIYLNPVPELGEIPIKRFYRYVFDHEVHFNPQTGAPATPMAYFDELPQSALYTLGVDTIKSWHVTVKEANMDLDNIRLERAEASSVSAVYELEHILIEGHCVDAATQSPPRGLQFVLSATTNASSFAMDTIVMANLGYFQFKAEPGVWEVGLRSGRSSQVYHIESIGTDGNWEKRSSKVQPEKNKENKHLLALTSFEGLTIFPQVRKNPGMENEDVLAEPSPAAVSDHEEDSLWSSLTKKLFHHSKMEEQEPKAAVQSRHAYINIFSVASGQLYERFMSIMIVSVMKHTNSSVKFWFIENFLSPSFKDFLPELAKEYKFEYEMVTYKWPSWLRSQKEKQRTIWGYKILFLDVLFPLDLDKVIFVDADQIVRTDLKELVDMDLHGAPYGYTPFCSDRTEMDGFRFWNQGYWKEHLQGKPYHISALYVVDLNRFRQMAAGDRLRAQYQQLSADPNSLANLDQDLPNNMQHVVPIYSLPQEWLWCETWCSDESLKKAKTIDLCNNPLTKEPKLDRARRQVPEWEAYDREIDALRKKVAARNQPAEEISQEKKDTKHIADEL